MIDPALLDVVCPLCLASPLEPCTANGRYMESTVHFPRRVQAGVPLEEKSEPKPRGRPKGSTAGRTDPTKCGSGKHDWTEDNIFTSTDGHDRCRPCRNEARRLRGVAKRQRTNVQHRHNNTHCRHGHEYTPENTYRAPGNGSRRCIACKKTQRKNDYAKKKEVA